MTIRTKIRMALLALFAAAGLAACATGSSGPRGSASEAQNLVDHAIDAYDQNGTAAFAEMTAPSTTFVDRDLYIFVIGPDYRVVAHGLDADRVGDDAQVLVDANGKAYGNEIIAYATPNGVWVDYLFIDPLTGNEEPKSSWVVKHDGYIFGCGIYKNAAMPDAEGG